MTRQTVDSWRPQIDIQLAETELDVDFFLYFISYLFIHFASSLFLQTKNKNWECIERNKSSFCGWLVSIEESWRSLTELGSDKWCLGRQAETLTRAMDTFIGEPVSKWIKTKDLSSSTPGRSEQTMIERMLKLGEWQSSFRKDPPCSEPSFCKRDCFPIDIEAAASLYDGRWYSLYPFCLHIQSN